MTTLAEAEQRIGWHIKSDHPYAYKTGQWATIVDAREGTDRNLWMLIWPDGKTDSWVVDDPTADYKFRDPFHTADVCVEALETLQEITIAVIRDEMAPGIRAPRELRDELTRLLEAYVDKAHQN